MFLWYSVLEFHFPAPTATLLHISTGCLNESHAIPLSKEDTGIDAAVAARVESRTAAGQEARGCAKDADLITGSGDPKEEKEVEEE